MRSIWNRKPTQSPVAVGQFVAPVEEGGDPLFYRDGSFRSLPNSLVTPAPGVPALQLDFGFGQSVTLDFGGFRSVGPPPPEEP